MSNMQTVELHFKVEVDLDAVASYIETYPVFKGEEIKDILIREAFSTLQYDGITDKVEQIEGQFRCPDCTCVHLHKGG